MPLEGRADFPRVDRSSERIREKSSPGYRGGVALAWTARVSWRPNSRGPRPWATVAPASGSPTSARFPPTRSVARRLLYATSGRREENRSRENALWARPCFPRSKTRRFAPLESAAVSREEEVSRTPGSTSAPGTRGPRSGRNSPTHRTTIPESRRLWIGGRVGG